MKATGIFVQQAGYPCGSNNSHSILSRNFSPRKSLVVLHMGGLVVARSSQNAQLVIVLARKACQKALSGSLGITSWLAVVGHQHHQMAGALTAFAAAMDFALRLPFAL